MPSAELTPASVHEPDPVRPTRDDEVAAAGSELIGGPIGRRALLGTSWWTPVRVVALVAIGMFALGLVQKAPCYTSGWFFGASSQYTHACYSDIRTSIRGAVSPTGSCRTSTSCPATCSTSNTRC